MELTPKQREVAKCLKAGARPADVAKALGIQKTTLRMHIQGIKKFYEVATHEEAIKKAAGRGDL